MNVVSLCANVSMNTETAMMSVIITTPAKMLLYAAMARSGCCYVQLRLCAAVIGAAAAVYCYDLVGL